MRPSVLALTTLDDEEKGAVTERKGDTESNVESVLWTQYSGAAARQSARDFGKPVGPRRSRDDSALGEHRRESPQNRESGISLAAEFENLRVDDVVKGEPVPDIPRYGAFSRRTLHCHSCSPSLDPSKRLPTELSYAILSHLDIWELVRCERVSKRWRRLVLDPSLRRQEFMSNWAANSVDGLISSHVGGEGIGKANTLHQNWTKMYRARQEMERRWREGPNNELTTAIYLNGHTDSVYCVQFDEHKVITGSRDRTFRIWDAKTGELRLTVGVPNALESDRRHGSRISTQEALSGPMRVVNRPAGTYCAYKVPDFYHNASILCLQFDDELLVTGSSDHSLIMWDIRNYQPIRRLQQHTAGVLDITFDKQKIVSCSKDGTICIWDRATGKLLSILSGHRGPVNAVQMRGNRIVTASGEGIAKLWELDERGLGTPDAEIQGRCLREFRSKDRGLACVEFSADGRFVMAGGNDKVIYKFDARTGQLVEVYKGHKGLVRSLYLDQPNRRLVTGSYDNELKCWDYVDDNGGNSTGSERWGLSRWATSWILSAKGDYRRLVTTSQDGRALLLDFGTGIPGAAMLEA